MRFNGVQCVSCKNTFTENDDVVVCPDCGSPHHRECWLNKGECENKALHSEGFIWEFPEELKPGTTEEAPSPETVETQFQFKNGENAVVCPYCSTINYGNDAFCMKCRRPFVQTEVPGYDGMGDMPPMSENEIFSYYQRFGGLRPDIMIDGIPVSEYADYIGEKKSGRYLRRFATMERYNKKISVSICAFLFGPIWYLYRKMFKEGIVYLLIMLLFTGLQTWGSLTEPVKQMYSEMASYYTSIMNGSMTMEEYEATVNELAEKYAEVELSKTDKIKSVVSNIAYFANIAAALGFTFAADYLYKKKVKSEILKTRPECHDMYTYRQRLREKGGVSVGGAVIGTLAVGVIYLLPVIPAYIIMFNSIL